MSRSKFPSAHIRELDRLVRPHGWEWTCTRKHVKFRHPTHGMVVTSASPSDSQHAKRNAIGEFRRRGTPV